MPEHTLTLSPEDEAKLERIRIEEGLDTIDQAAELLIKQRLRRVSREANGRGRALYPVVTTKRSTK